MEKCENRAGSKHEVESESDVDKNCDKCVENSHNRGKFQLLADFRADEFNSDEFCLSLSIYLVDRIDDFVRHAFEHKFVDVSVADFVVSDCIFLDNRKFRLCNKRAEVSFRDLFVEPDFYSVADL